MEEAYKFGNFFSPVLSESDFDAKPSVLLLGQYSTGKAPGPRPYTLDLNPKVPDHPTLTFRA